MIVVDGQKDIPRSLFIMLDLIFDTKMWSNVVIQVSNWKYDDQSIQNRKNSIPPITEHGIRTYYRDHIVVIMNVTNATVPVTFIDPFYESWNSYATVPFIHNIDFLESILYTNDSPYYYPNAEYIRRRDLIIVYIAMIPICMIGVILMFAMMIYVPRIMNSMCPHQRPHPVSVNLDGTWLECLGTSAPNAENQEIGVSDNTSKETNCCRFITSCV